MRPSFLDTNIDEILGYKTNWLIVSLIHLFFVTISANIHYFYSMRSSLSILFYLKFGSTPRDGRLPLMCRITIDGENTSFSCKRRIDPDRWDARRGMMTGQDEEALMVNQELDQLREQLKADCAGILQEYGSIRPKWMKEYTLGAPERHEMLLYMFDKHNEDFRKMVGHGRSMKSLRRYEVVYRHLRSFIRTQYQLEDIRVKYVTIKLIHAFEQYLFL